MRSIVKFFILLPLLFVSAVSAKTESSLDEGMVNPGYEEQPAWFKNSFLDLEDDVAEAAENGKRLVIFFYQDGCPYCKKLLQDNFGQRDIADKARKNFDIVSLNIWGDREVTFAGVTAKEKDFAAQLKVMYTPTLIFFNEQGRPILRTNGYYHPGKFNAALDYVSGKHELKENFRSYLGRMSPEKSRGKIHTDVATLKPPYNFSSSSDKYRLVMFEQKHCKECDELHNDILKRSESQQLLKQFDVAVLDMWSEDGVKRPDGKQSSIKQWAKDLNIQYAPSLVYFDPSGKEVFRSDAYLRAFHIQSVMDYVASGAYKKQSNFQRYIDDRAHKLREQGIEVDIMK